nr:unnamed protein product [Callosobruchus analis]
MGNDIYALKAAILSLQTEVRAISCRDKDMALSGMKFEQVVLEVFERQNRRNNVIVFDLKELGEAAQDKAEVTKVLTHLSQSVTITSIFRIGKFDRDRKSPRPVSHVGRFKSGFRPNKKVSRTEEFLRNLSVLQNQPIKHRVR